MVIYLLGKQIMLMDNNDSFINKLGETINRIRCETYTRCMWYLRPVSFFNLWKKSEFYSRKYFKDTSQKSVDLRKRENVEFTSKYKDVNQQ